MKVTLNWLKEYVEFDWSPEELSERLTMLGLEVEDVAPIGGEWDGVVVAQVLTKDRHPNADKLWLCRVQDGHGERQIVCGAQNFNAGDKVPLIVPGASLPAKPGEPPFTIKVAKVRGVESHGMLCSPKELGLADDAQGLLILPSDGRVGQPLAEHLGRARRDVVYDLEITPNRPDLNSVIGIAREIAAVTGHPLHWPEVTLPPKADAASQDLVAVRIEDAQFCPRYTARVVREVKIGPSPDWLRTTLEKVGLRSLNNVVDVTNYVMLETGQPLHAFDYRRVAPGTDGRPTIVIRRAREKEPFTTLDGQSHTLTSEDLLIADEQKGIALAGVMGGQNSEINEQTADVLIESACFHPSVIRRTSKRLGLHTDASYRFERGADIAICDWASQRAAQLLLTTAGGQLAGGVVDAHPAPASTKTITLRHAKVNALLGIELSPAEIEHYLGQLGLKIIGRKPRPVGVTAPPEPVTFQIPSFRVDLKREADLIEEVCRLHGVEKVPATPPRGLIGANEYDTVHDQLAEARRLLIGLGFHEAQGQTLIAESAARRLSPTQVALANPLSSDMSVLRPSLLPGLLDSLRHNLNHKNHDVALFEIGRVFVPAAAVPTEQRRLAFALTGQRRAPFWSGAERNAKCDLYDLKGLIEEFLEQFGVRGASCVTRAESKELFLESATLQLGRISLGELGQLLPSLAHDYDLRDPVLLAELDLNQLLARRNCTKSFKALPQFPSVRRDVAMVLEETVAHATVLAAIKQARAPHLELVELFDVFRGRNIPAGQKSMAYALTYRSAERTLTDIEVNRAHELVLNQLKQTLHAQVREGGSQ